MLAVGFRFVSGGLVKNEERTSLAAGTIEAHLSKNERAAKDNTIHYPKKWVSRRV